jgi:hypothetical protein
LEKSWSQVDVDKESWCRNLKERLEGSYQGRNDEVLMRDTIVKGHKALARKRKTALERFNDSDERAASQRACSSLDATRKS